MITEEEEAKLRERIAGIARGHLERGDATGWFDSLYEMANGNLDAIPWADLVPNRFLVDWDDGKLVEGSGKKALVVGCGLGDEARYMSERGFQVTAFDISEKAIEWAKRVNKDCEIDFLVADMFDPPKGWIGAFDVVIEVYTVQALPLSLRKKSIDAIASFVKPGGELVVVQRLRENNVSDPDGPPWALSLDELKRFEVNGLSEKEFKTYTGDEEEPIERFVALFERVVL